MQRYETTVTKMFRHQFVAQLKMIWEPCVVTPQRDNSFFKATEGFFLEDTGFVSLFFWFESFVAPVSFPDECFPLKPSNHMYCCVWDRLRSTAQHCKCMESELVSPSYSEGDEQVMEGVWTEDVFGICVVSGFFFFVYCLLRCSLQHTTHYFFVKWPTTGKVAGFRT